MIFLRKDDKTLWVILPRVLWRRFIQERWMDRVYVGLAYAANQASQPVQLMQFLIIYGSRIKDINSRVAETLQSSVPAIL